MSISFVICRCESDFNISISLCKLSNNFAVRLSFLTALIATVRLVSYTLFAISRANLLKVGVQGTYFMVPFVNVGKAPFANVIDNDVRPRFIIVSWLPPV